jgi:two-component system response regulator AtoC
MADSVEAGQGLVFLVEDDEASRMLFERWCKRAGFVVETFGDAESCVAAISSHMVDAVCLDLNLPGMDGLSALKRIHGRLPHLPVLVLTADTGVGTVVEAMKTGAYDYIPKPVDEQRLVTVLRNAVDRKRLAARVQQLERASSYGGIVGESPAMRAVFRQIDRVSTSDINVLVLGESGTGKELIARAIHDMSARGSGPFIAVNCAAIPDALMESEFFGHERGAFTGAAGVRKGRFEQAHGGTLFLDEVGELSAALQAKLLRVVQERRFCRVGGNAEIASNFRLITATHRNLGTAVRMGGFREDLYFRIAVFELELPPLRDRVGDVRRLVHTFVSQLAGDRALEVESEALALLEAYPWPGNVRELHNVIQRAVVVCDGGAILASSLPSKLQSTATFPQDERTAPALPSTLVDLERAALRRSLEKHGGNVSEVVRELGMGRTTVYRKIKEYNLK